METNLSLWVGHIPSEYCYQPLCCFIPQSDFAHNEKFITLNIVKGDGKKVYFPGTLLHETVPHTLYQLPLLFLTDKFTVQGVKINTPHYLAKLENLPRGVATYTVIVSQLESLSTIHYTLRVSIIIRLASTWWLLVACRLVVVSYYTHC